MVPFNIYLNLTNHGFKVDGYFKITWMKIKLVKREIKSEKTPKDIKKEGKIEEKNKELNLKKITRIISLFWESLPHIIKIFKAFLKSVKIEQIYIRAIIGLGSPVDTVKTCGHLWSLEALLKVFPYINLLIEPDFQKEMIETEITLKIKLRLFWIIFESLRAIAKKPVRSL